MFELYLPVSPGARHNRFPRPIGKRHRRLLGRIRRREEDLDGEGKVMLD